MKLAIVYNPTDNKLQPNAYCSVFRGMFDALIARFEDVQRVTQDCSASDIDADLIFFFDPHSSHHIEIDGVANHPALKMEYWNDPHQKEAEGFYMSTGLPVHKLGREQRVKRADKRGIDLIVSSVKYKFYEYFFPYMSFRDMESRMVHFPPAPSFAPIATPLAERKHAVLANGATWGGTEIGAYVFRKQVYQSPFVEAVEHHVKDKSTPSGDGYGSFLGQYAGALALCDVFPVVKYYEIPLAGCVCFAQHHHEYAELGFKDLENCIYVDALNYEKRIKQFMGAQDFAFEQKIADAGRELVANNYTAKHFADMIYEKCSTEVHVT